MEWEWKVDVVLFICGCFGFYVGADHLLGLFGLFFLRSQVGSLVDCSRSFRDRGPVERFLGGGFRIL